MSFFTQPHAEPAHGRQHDARQRQQATQGEGVAGLRQRTGRLRSFRNIEPRVGVRRYLNGIATGKDDSRYRDGECLDRSRVGRAAKGQRDGAAVRCRDGIGHGAGEVLRRTAGRVDAGSGVGDGRRQVFVSAVP